MNESNKRLRPLRLTDLNDDTIVRLYTVNKLSVYNIAKLTGFNYMTIRYRLKRLGVYEVGGHKPEDVPEIIYNSRGDIIGIDMKNGNIIPIER